MKSLYFISLLALGLGFTQSPRFVSYPVTSPIAHKIIGKWHLVGQEIFINGKEINQHFEEITAHLSAKSGNHYEAYLLADKFRKSFRSIPSGTVFEFNDDFSYRIVLPDNQVQDGLWRIKNAQTIVLNAQEQEMHMEIKSIGEEIATISIKEEKIDYDISGSRYMKMELVMDLSR